MERPRPNPENPANNPQFVYDLMERMDDDDAVREAVWAAFESGDLTFLFHDTQLLMFEMVNGNGSPELLIFCSRQIGKSFFILCFAIMHCLTHPRALVRIFCKTSEQVNDIIADNMAIVERLAPPGLIKRMKSEKRWRVGRGTIRIGPLAAAHVDGKRGGNATLCILEEGGFTPSDQYRRAIGNVINAQLMRSSGRLVHVTTPSEDLAHYVHTVVLPKCERVGAVARYTIYDNPQLTDAQIEETHARCTSEEEWEREYLVAVRRSEVSTVIPEFADRHVALLKPPAYAHWLTSLDFGGTVDKHGILLCYYDFERAKLCFFAERFLEKNTATRTIVTESVEMEKPAKWRTDDGKPRRVSDCPGQIVVDLRADGFNVRTPEKGDGSWEAGINALRLAFLRDQVEIDPSCRHLLMSLKYGQFTANRKDFQRTEQLGHLDMISAAIYAWRHKVVQNPFPPLLGKHRETHHTRAQVEAVKPLAEALFPSYLR